MSGVRGRGGGRTGSDPRAADPAPDAGGSGPRAARFVLPEPLRELAGGARTVRLDAGPRTVGEALAALRDAHPAVHARLVTERGELRPHVNLFVGREEVRRTGGLDTPLDDGSEILVLPSVSGG